MSEFLPPRKRFGQNFLSDPGIVRKILEAARITPGTRVLEIGPGRGALTEPLLAAGARLTVCEIDRDLARAWRERAIPGLRVVEADILACDWGSLLPEPPYVLVANLPYNISTPILFDLVAQRERFARLVLMFQREVAERLRALPDSRAYGALSVLLQCWFAIERVCVVRPGAFFPPPKVHSEVLLFEPLAQPPVSAAEWPAFSQLVRAAFAQRRKTLRNALLGAGHPAVQLDAGLAAAGVDGRRRAETLTLEEFLALRRALPG